MWRYIVRRLLWTVLVVLIITAFTYLIFFVMPPTDPAVQFAGKNPTPEQIAVVRHQLGLDKPVWPSTACSSSTSSPATSTAGPGSASPT